MLVSFCFPARVRLTVLAFLQSLPGLCRPGRGSVPARRWARIAAWRLTDVRHAR